MTRKKSCQDNFNTSHVYINLGVNVDVQVCDRHFNTSHVYINPDIAPVRQVFSSISIHLMFILIQRFYQLFRFYYISNSLKIPAFSNFSQV